MNTQVRLAHIFFDLMDENLNMLTSSESHLVSYLSSSMSEQAAVDNIGCNKEKSKTTGKRICCVCKPTKHARDECVVLNGEEKCKIFIEAHNQCLRSEGFDVV